MLPELTVSMPAYNRASYIREAVESALKQQGVTFEVIVVDDGSDDDTASVVAELNDPRIRILRNDTRMGISYSHNRVVAESSAPFIVHLDSDDVLIRPYAFRKLLDLILSDDALGMVHGHFVLIDQYGRASRGQVRKILEYQKRTRVPGRDYRRALLREGAVMNAPRLYRKSVFETVGNFNEALPYGVDYEMALQIADQFRIDVVPEALIAYREHNRRITSHSFRAFRYWWLRVRLSGSLSRSRQISYARKRWLYHRQGLYEAFGLGLLVVTARRQAHHTREHLRRMVKAALFRSYLLFIKPLSWFPLRPGITRRKNPNAGPGLCAYYIWCFPTPSETFIRRELAKVSEADIPVMVVAETRHPETDSGSMPQIPGVAVHFIDESGSEDLQTGYYRIRRQNRFRFWYLYLYTMCHRYGFFQSPTEDMSVVKQAAILAGFLDSKNVTHIHTPWADRSAFIAMLAADLLNITYSVQARAHESHPHDLVAGHDGGRADVVQQNRTPSVKHHACFLTHHIC